MECEVNGFSQPAVGVVMIELFAKPGRPFEANAPRTITIENPAPGCSMLVCQHHRAEWMGRIQMAMQEAVA
jgi:hypothetical protein